MIDLRKAAEMALNALELNTGYGFDPVIEALRQALAQDALKKLAEVDHELGLFIYEPPKREWVGLTDEESVAMLQKAAKHKSPDYCTAPEMAIEFGRLASEALKEKNT